MALFRYTACLKQFCKHGQYGLPYKNVRIKKKSRMKSTFNNTQAVESVIMLSMWLCQLCSHCDWDSFLHFCFQLCELPMSTAPANHTSKMYHKVSDVKTSGIAFVTLVYSLFKIGDPSFHTCEIQSDKEVGDTIMLCSKEFVLYSDQREASIISCVSWGGEKTMLQLHYFSPFPTTDAVQVE